MADNDVFDDYYGIAPPIEGGRTMEDIRSALDDFVSEAGNALHGVGKKLVPNIAESRREPGRWARHARFGGGYEEVWLAWGPDEYLDAPTALAQTDQVAGPGVTIMRVATDGNDSHQNFTYGLAAFWIFGGGHNGAYTATGHDDYSVTLYIPQLGLGFGRTARKAAPSWQRPSHGTSPAGWAGVNFNAHRRRTITFKVPPGLVDLDGNPAPRSVLLGPHEGGFVPPTLRRHLKVRSPCP